MGRNMRIIYLTLVVCISSLNESTGVQNLHRPIIAISYTGYQDLGEGDVTALSETMYASAVHNVHYNTCNQLLLGYHAYVTIIT